ncbi:hypothetical protein [Kaistella jeonii]|uniref:hypothetical protein n=1 Tax=Kaistella jeonii TaxID=266749 RepID=UPI00068ED87F|nr:hypothetical protein [Kaistella jeonii]SFB90591.1 hypothetical protein SAMN05421876_103339 [Kaistella jeonii]VEI95788.1 Uncharacterised protein [Kaistella jeonii]
MTLEKFKLAEEANDQLFEGDKVIYDGIVDFVQYSQSSPKILWILKEANSEEHGWTMRDALKNLKNINKVGLTDGWANTFTSIVYTTNGIFTGEDWDSMGNFYEDQSIINVMEKVAYINVKKIPGGSLADWNLIKRYYSENKIALHEQIKMINPEVIIFGGTYNFFDDDFFNSFGELEENVENNSLHIYQNKNHLLLNAYHPNNRVIKHSTYCNLILHAFKNWQLKYSN